MKKKNNNKNQDFSIYTKEIKRKKFVNDDYKMAVSFVIVLVIVLVCIGGLFILNGKFVSKDILQDKTTTTTTTPSYDDTVILVNRILSVNSSKYYVMVYDFEDEVHSVLYSSLVSSYAGSDIKLYSTNIGIALNKKYYNKEKSEKLNVKSYKEFNFTRPVLLEINKNKVSKTITDKDEIHKILKEAK